MASLQQLVHEIEKDEKVFQFSSDRHDPYTIAAVLKVGLFAVVGRYEPTDFFGFQALSSSVRHTVVPSATQRVSLPIYYVSLVFCETS
jgi:hypothetical protein